MEDLAKEDLVAAMERDNKNDSTCNTNTNNANGRGRFVLVPVWDRGVLLKRVETSRGML